MTGPSSDDLVLADVVEEHLEELDFLLETRQGSIFSPDFRPLHLQRLEERIEAHTDGVREGAEAGLEAARRALAGDTWSLRAAGAWACLRRPSPALDLVVSGLAAADDETALGLRLGLRHAPRDVLPMFARRLPPEARSDFSEMVLLDARAFRERSVPAEELRPFLAHASGAVRMLAWSARLRCGPGPDRRELSAAVEDEDALVRARVLEAAARWGVREVLGLARDAAARGGERDAEAIRALGAFGGAEEFALLRAAVDGAAASAALSALGALGDLRAVPVLLSAIAVPGLAWAAGNAFTAMVGEPLGLVPVEVSGELERLPDPAEAMKIWEKRSAGLAPSERWSGGRAVDQMGLAEIFGELNLEAARDAYLRSCLRAGGSAQDFELESLAAERGRPIRP